MSMSQQHYPGAMLALLMSLTSSLSMAADAHSAAEAKQDAQRHRAMAAAHTAAAQCLEAGKSADQCLADLQKTCKGLAIGKYCGMKHAH